MRNFKIMPQTAASEPLTGMGVYEPQAVIRWSPQGVSLGGVTTIPAPDPNGLIGRSGKAGFYAPAPHSLHRAGQP